MKFIKLFIKHYFKILFVLISLLLLVILWKDGLEKNNPFNLIAGMGFLYLMGVVVGVVMYSAFEFCFNIYTKLKDFFIEIKNEYQGFTIENINKIIIKVVDRFFQWYHSIDYQLLILIFALVLWWLSIPIYLYYLYIKKNVKLGTFSKNSRKPHYFCDNCKKENNHNAKFCNYCGSILTFQDSLYQDVINNYDGILVALLAKVSKADGQISNDEASYMSSIYDMLSKSRQDIPNIREIYKQILNNEKNNSNNIELFCTKLIKLNLSEEAYIPLITSTIALAFIDNDYHQKEEKIILEIVNKLNFNFSLYKDIISEFKNMNNRHTSSNLDIYYQILESKKDDSDIVIKQNYRRLVKLHHPDKFTQKDFSDKVIKNAENKIKQINNAYQVIKDSRKI